MFGIMQRNMQWVGSNDDSGLPSDKEARLLYRKFLNKKSQQIQIKSYNSVNLMMHINEIQKKKSI